MLGSQQGSLTPSSSSSPIQSSSSSRPPLSRSSSSQQNTSSSRMPLSREVGSVSLITSGQLSLSRQRASTSLQISSSSSFASTSSFDYDPTASYASTSSEPPPSHSFPESLLIKKEELTNLEKIGEGTQGLVFKAEWQGQLVVYKQMKLIKSALNDVHDKTTFVREFNVWQYVPFFILISNNSLLDMQYTNRVWLYMGSWMKEMNSDSLLNIVLTEVCILL